MLIKYSKRKSIAIRISLLGDAVVSAPKGLPDYVLNKFLAERKEWINAALLKSRELRIKYSGLIDMTKCLLFGQELSIVWTQQKRSVIDGQQICLPINRAQNKKESIIRWYKKCAYEYLSGRLQELSNYYGLPYNDFSITGAKSKWGSCSAGKKILLNFRLIMLENKLIDYVILHELVHTRHMNHSWDFWSDLKRICPGCREYSKRLKGSVLMEIYD